MKIIHAIIALTIIFIISTPAWAGETSEYNEAAADLMQIVEQIEMICRNHINDYYYRLQNKNLTNRTSHDYFMSDREWWFVEGKFKLCEDIFGFMGKKVEETKQDGGGNEN